MDTSKGSAHQPQSFTVKQKDSTILSLHRTRGDKTGRKNVKLSLHYTAKAN
ncbi:hypothetical protein COLO4_01781 [Corchorus olitorius]|uniref:Uncharacterized protein n=1 Tax=Corchorus olitorius TaxID=93759 RepID=A0A1R3L222_9ROSI|nr:hypothetical protein COLO4_01781 [Corchorus olitorius]